MSGTVTATVIIFWLTLAFHFQYYKKCKYSFPLKKPGFLGKIQTNELQCTWLVCGVFGLQRNHAKLNHTWTFPIFCSWNISTYSLNFQSSALFAMFLSCGLLNNSCVSPEMQIPRYSTNEVCKFFREECSTQMGNSVIT